MKESICNNCAYWLFKRSEYISGENEPPETIKWGECHLHPPTLGQHNIWLWCETLSEDFCSHFELFTINTHTK